MEVSTFDFNSIPNELGLHIFSFLSPRDINIAALVNRRFSEWADDKCFEKPRAAFKAVFFGYDPEYCSESHQEYCKKLKRETKDLHREGLLPPEYVVCKIKGNQKILYVFQTLLKLKNFSVAGIYTYLFSSDQFAKTARCFAVFLESRMAQGNIQFPEFYNPLDQIFQNKALRQIRVGFSIRETNPYSGILFKLLLRFEPNITSKQKKFFINAYHLKNSFVLSRLKFAYQNEKDPLNKKGYAFLIDAHQGNQNQMEQQLKKGAELNFQDDSDWTALHHATHQGHVDIVKFLIKQGACMEHQSKGYKTPLELAMKRNKLEIAEIFIANGAIVNASDGYGWAPLHFAAQQGHQKLAEILIEKGADFNALDSHGCTPLMFALEENHPEIAGMLLATDADVKIADFHGLTALHHAVNQELHHIIPLLIEKGADVNAQTKEGSSPLLYAASLGNLPLVDLLLDFGANPNLPFSNHLYPWLEATLEGHVEVRDRLLALSPVQQDNIQFKLFLAVFEGNKAKVQNFLRDGADLNIPCLEGHPSLLLHWAVYSKRISIVKLLLELGADKNSRGAGGNTPLHFALNGLPESEEIVSLLIEGGADLDLKNEKGLSCREKMKGEGK